MKIVAAPNSSLFDESDDDDSDWIPLDEVSEEECHNEENAAKHTRVNENYKDSSFLNFSIQNEFKSSKENTFDESKPTSKNATNYETETDIDDIRTRLENRMRLREGLATHPLKSFGKFFLKYMMEQLWENRRIRFGEFLFFFSH